MEQPLILVLQERKKKHLSYTPLHHAHIQTRTSWEVWVGTTFSQVFDPCLIYKFVLLSATSWGCEVWLSSHFFFYCPIVLVAQHANGSEMKVGIGITAVNVTKYRCLPKSDISLMWFPEQISHWSRGEGGENLSLVKISQVIFFCLSLPHIPTKWFERSKTGRQTYLQAYELLLEWVRQRIEGYCLKCTSFVNPLWVLRAIFLLQSDADSKWHLHLLSPPYGN